MTKKINICLSTDDNYIHHTATVLASILFNSKAKNVHYHFYILSTDLSQTNKERLNQIKQHNICKISFIELADDLLDPFKQVKMHSHLTIATFNRLFIPQLFPNLDKIIYIDSDLVVLDDIHKLDEIDVSGYYFAGVKDANSKGLVKKHGYDTQYEYINAGVIIINIEELLAHDYFNKILSQIGKIQAQTGDQDFINYCFHEKIKIISYKWNMYHKFHFESYNGKQPLEDKDYVEAIQHPKIVHFVGPDKPWNSESKHPYKSEYLKYLKMTPWAHKAQELSLENQKSNIVNEIVSVNKEIGKEKKLTPAFASNNIPIVFASDENYAPYLSVVIQSIIENSSLDNNYDIVILEKNISEQTKKMILSMQKFNVSIRFENVARLIKNVNFHINTYFSEETYYRLFIPTIFENFTKVIYLDCDIIVLEDLANLFSLKLEKNLLAATYNISTQIHTKHNKPVKNTPWRDYLINTLMMHTPENYFQAGVLVMNVTEMKKFHFQDKALKLSQELNPLFVDQDVMNSICQNKVMFFSQQWNLHNNFSPQYKNMHTLAELSTSLQKEYLAARANPYIIHYAGKEKSWNTPALEFAHLWWKYARQTVFYEIILFKNLNQTQIKLTDISSKNNDKPSITLPEKENKTAQNKTQSTTTIQKIKNLLRFSTKRSGYYVSYKIFDIQFYKKFLKYEYVINKTTSSLEYKLNKQVKDLGSKLSNIMSQESSRALSVYNLHQKVFPKYKNIHQGKDVVLVATGPSLNSYIPIENTIYIGVNKAFKYGDINFDYLFLQDYSMQTPSYIDDFMKYKAKEKFIGILDDTYLSKSIIPEHYSRHEKIVRYYINPVQKNKSFTFDISSQALGDANSIVFAAMQFILWTHPRKIYLVGCDCSHSGYFTSREENYLEVDEVLSGWVRLKEFIKIYYPDIEIISINPVGLKGMFKDIYAHEDSYVEEL